MDEFLKQFREQYSGAYDNMPDADLAAAIHRRFYSELPYEEFAHRVQAKHGPPPEVTEKPDMRTPQPPFATLPPMVGGALDALVAFGNLGAFGLPALLSKDTREYTAELKERAPDAYMASGIAGGLATGLASAPLFAARAAAIGPYQVATGSNAMQAIPSVAGSAARSVGGALAGVARPAAARALPLLRTAAKGTGLLGGWELLRRLGVVGGQ